MTIVACQDKKLYLARSIEAEENEFLTEKNKPVCFDSLDKMKEYLLNLANRDDIFNHECEYKITSFEKKKYNGGEYWISFCPSDIPKDEEEEYEDTYIIVPFSIRETTKITLKKKGRDFEAFN